jgi:hypothetical protein
MRRRMSLAARGGTFAGLPLMLSGMRKTLEAKDWQPGQGQTYQGILATVIVVGMVGEALPCRCRLAAKAAHTSLNRLPSGVPGGGGREAADAVVLLQVLLAGSESFRVYLQAGGAPRGQAAWSRGRAACGSWGKRRQ